MVLQELKELKEKEAKCDKLETEALNSKKRAPWLPIQQLDQKLSLHLWELKITSARRL